MFTNNALFATVPFILLCYFFFLALRFHTINHELHKKVLWGSGFCLVLSLISFVFVEYTRMPFLIRLCVQRFSFAVSFFGTLYVIYYFVSSYFEPQGSKRMSGRGHVTVSHFFHRIPPSFALGKNIGTVTLIPTATDQAIETKPGSNWLERRATRQEWSTEGEAPHASAARKGDMSGRADGCFNSDARREGTRGTRRGATGAHWRGDVARRP